MNEIIIIPCFAFWFSELSSIPQYILHWINFVYWLRTGKNELISRLKPFDCAKCLGFWMGFFYSYNLTNNLLWSVLSAGVFSLITMILSIIYNGFKRAVSKI